MRVVRKKIEEASKTKLLNYIGKAVHSYGRSVNAMHFAPTDVMKNSKTQTKRFVGIDQAARKLAGNRSARVAANEEVDIAVRSFYAKHYAKNYNRFIRKNPAKQSIQKAQHSAYVHVGNKYGSEVEKQLKQFHTNNEMSEDTINEITRKVLNSYIKKAHPSASKLSRQAYAAHQNEPWSDVKSSKKSLKRVSGIVTAAYKTQLGKEGGSVHQWKAWPKKDTTVNEDTILEMTDGKIRQYIGKALGDTKRKRTKSINLAADKIEKTAKVPATLEEARNKPIPDHPYHLKTDAELKYIQKDAHAAAKAMRDHDEKAEGKYLDQVNDASTVLYYRKKHGKGKDEPKKIDEALKLVKTYEAGPHSAKVYKDNEYDEHRVKFFTDGKHHEKADYHTGDKEDAHDTAQSWLNKQEDKRANFVNRKEGFKKKINEDLTEARIRIIKARIRNGKIQRRKKVATQPGWTLRGGKLKRMSASERRKRKLGQRRGKIKRRTKLSRTLVKRKRSLIKRQRLHLK